MEQPEEAAMKMLLREQIDQILDTAFHLERRWY
jgi:hypothetical protein